MRASSGEELGIAAEMTCARFARVKGTDFRMDIWAIDHWAGEPAREPLEHDLLAWLNDTELHGLRLADPGHLSSCTRHSTRRDRSATPNRPGDRSAARPTPDQLRFVDHVLALQHGDRDHFEPPSIGGKQHRRPGGHTKVRDVLGPPTTWSSCCPHRRHSTT